MKKLFLSISISFALVFFMSSCESHKCTCNSFGHVKKETKTLHANNDHVKNKND